MSKNRGVRILSKDVSQGLQMQQLIGKAGLDRALWGRSAQFENTAESPFPDYVRAAALFLFFYRVFFLSLSLSLSPSLSLSLSLARFLFSACVNDLSGYLFGWKGCNRMQGLQIYRISALRNKCITQRVGGQVTPQSGQVYTLFGFFVTLCTQQRPNGFKGWSMYFRSLTEYNLMNPL